jgi:hypothetical protein
MPVLLEALEQIFIGNKEPSLSVAYRKPNPPKPTGKQRGAILLGNELNPPVYKVSLTVWGKGHLLLSIAAINGRQDAKPYKYLKSVTDPKYEAVLFHILHEGFIEPFTVLRPGEADL